MQENVPKGLYSDTANAFVRSSVLSAPIPPSPTPPSAASRDPETYSRVPEHFIFSLRATYAMKLLRNFYTVSFFLDIWFFFLKIWSFFFLQTALKRNSNFPYSKRKIRTWGIAEKKFSSFYIDIGVLAILYFSLNFLLLARLPPSTINNL